MSMEPPVLRLGLAGFSAEAQEALVVALSRAGKRSGVGWEVARFADADAWWVNGAKVQKVADGTLRVAPGQPSARSVQLNLADIDRPIAFALPLAPRDFEPACSFEPQSQQSIEDTLARFHDWLRPVVAQFCLASQILEHEVALSSAVHHVMSGGRLIAVVCLRGQVAVLPSAGPADFEDARWVERSTPVFSAPESFVNCSLSQLMWQYALRTHRDVLPARYRKGLLYFRRPPRLPQRMLRDSHLLLLRELAVAPASFDDLVRRTLLKPDELASELAALYLVGSITTNPKRASTAAIRRADTGDSSGLQSSTPSELDSRAGPLSFARPSIQGSTLNDVTAPVPLGPVEVG